MEENAHRLPATILLIENDDNDVFFFRRAVAKAGWIGDVRVVGTATEAQAYIENKHPFTDPAYYRRPQLIVSDYRLAGKTAQEFVSWLRDQPACAGIPIVILSGLTSDLVAEGLGKLKPTALIGKTVDIDKLAAALEPFLPPS